ncbi:MAG: hypothetical protein AAFX93_15640 [Verrucomicrobiota bacterium]
MASRSLNPALKAQHLGEETMSWEISFAANGAVTVVTRGRYTAEGQAQMVQDILDHEKWQPGTKTFFDHRELSFESVDYEAMMNASRVHQNNNERIGNSRTAILLPDMVAYGSSRQFLSLSAGKISATIKLFTREKDAQRWLITEDDAS